MTVSELLASLQGSALTNEVEIDFSGITVAILSAQTSRGKLSITAATAHTLALIQAEEANKSTLKSLQSVNLALTFTQQQRDKLQDMRVKDFVDKGMLHIPPHGPDEAALMVKVKAGDI